VVYRADWEAGPQTSRLVVSVNQALTPGGDYRLWLAFDKPMRWRSAAGSIADYPGQNVPLAPELALEAPGLGTLDLATSAASWLTEPGAAPDGYRRYATDALSVPFTVPASWAPQAAAGAVLLVRARDMTRSALDADPATPVDFAGGHWTGFESRPGETGDTGGPDCSFKPFVATDGSAAAPAPVGCSAFTGQAPGGGGSGGGSNSGGGGGGGAMIWSALALLALLRHRRWPRPPGA
jgi:hypothetical protein